MKNLLIDKPLVLVAWVDACDWDGDLSQVMKPLPIRESVGYLVRCDEEAVGLCHCLDYAGDFALGNDAKYEGAVIPRPWVRSITYLTRQELKTLSKHQPNKVDRKQDASV